MNLRHIPLSAAALLLAGAPASLHAQEPGLHVLLHYDGRLLVKVFDMQVEERVTASTHSSSARFQSYGVLAAFRHFDMRVTSAGRVVKGTPQPGVFTNKNFASKSRRNVEVTWRAGNVTTVAAPAYTNLGDPAATAAQKLAAADPLTQVMRMSLNGSRADVCNRTVRIFDGKQLYDLHFSNPQAVAAGAREQRLGLGAITRCSVRFEEIAGFKAKPPSQRDQGFKHGIAVDFAQVGAGGPWVLSSIRGSTPLGRAAVELSALTVIGRDPTE